MKLAKSVKPMKYWQASLVICVAVLLSGCAGGPLGGTHAKSSPTAPLPTPTVSLSPLTMQQAWGNAQISQFSLDMGNQDFAPTAEDNGVTDDGQVCGGTFPMRSRDVSTVSGSVGLIDLHTGHITLFATMPPGYIVMYCTVTGPWVIWQQSANDAAGNPSLWAIKAFNRQTGEVRLLDQSKEPDATHPYPPILPEPDASNGRVVWTAYSDDTIGETQSEMYTFATGAKTVLADHTSFPLISWPWVSWGDGTEHAIVFENLETKQQAQLPMTYPPTSAAFSGTSYVYTNSDYSQVTLVPSILAQRMTSVVIEDKSMDGSYFDEFPTLNNRLVSWVGPYAWLVFDRKLQRPVKIPIGVAGFGGFISSHYLVATPALTQADFNAQRSGLPFHHVMFVLDTNTLP